jgi:transposase-like protein
VIVWPCRLDVSAYAALGRDVAPPRVRCPRCGGPTGPWSGYLRHVRDTGLHRIFVPRVRCRRCGRTAALLPWFVTPYRWDSVDVIGHALGLAVTGVGVRRIAALLERPETTVREWCRRFGRVATDLARVLLAAAVRMGWSGLDLPTAPGPRCLAAVDALAAAWTRRRGLVEPWRPAALVTGGAWLASNTTSPLAPASVSPLMAGTSRPTSGGDPCHRTRPRRSPCGDIT